VPLTTPALSAARLLFTINRPDEICIVHRFPRVHRRLYGRFFVRDVKKTGRRARRTGDGGCELAFCRAPKGVVLRDTPG
jgi:hypothetical protein